MITTQTDSEFFQDLEKEYYNRADNEKIPAMASYYRGMAAAFNIASGHIATMENLKK